MVKLTLAKLVTKRTCIAGLIVAFVVLAVWISSTPYEPTEDLADATTNWIWVRYYDEGRLHVSWDSWQNQTWHTNMTQSVVVLHDGEYVVVNEKGPGFIALLHPFFALGMEKAFGTVMAGVAVLSVFMLGRRIAGWKAGYIAAVICMCNLTFIVMWHRYYWTDAATMHLMALSFYLLVEGLYWSNGRSLSVRDKSKPSRDELLFGLLLTFAAGVVFTASVSTRYPAALVLIAALSYLAIHLLLRIYGFLRKRIGSGMVIRSLVVALVFIAGLGIALVPLVQYNTEYFGGPFSSGYDQTSVMDFSKTQEIAARNTSEQWSSDTGGMINTALSNLVILTPLLITKMPALLLLPLGIYLMRKKAVLVLLLLWIAITFATYLSLEWVSMYAAHPETAWEPRYFMPALPPIAILAGISISWFAFERRVVDTRQIRSIAIAGVLLLPIMFFGIAPAARYLHAPQEGGIIPGTPGMQGNDVTLIATTDMLILHPEQFDRRFVRLDKVTVTGITPDGCIVQNAGSIQTGGIDIVFDSWPAAEMPPFGLGTTADAMGLFVHGQPPLHDHMNLKYGTQDFFNVISS